MAEIYDIFFQTLTKQRSKQSLEAVVQGILSKSEKLMIAKRVAILYLYNKTVPVGDIATTLKVSKATVYKFTTILEKNERLHNTLLSIANEKKLIDVFVEVVNDLHGVGTPTANWSRARTVKNKLERKKLRGI